MSEAPRAISLGYQPRAWQRAMHIGMATKRRGVLVVHRRAGKTTAAVMHLIDRAVKCALSNPRYAYIAPQLKQAKTLAWTWLQMYAKRIPSCTVHQAELAVRFPNMHGHLAEVRLHGADNPDALRGIYLDGVAIDEVAQVGDELWDSVLLPALTDRNGWALLMGTPKGINLLSRTYWKARSDQTWYVGEYSWDKTDALSDEQLNELRGQMTPNAWRREMDLDFSVAAEEQLIEMPIIQAASGRQGMADPYDPLVLGLDIGRFRDPSVLCWRQGRNATWPFERHHDLDLMQLCGRVAYLMDQRKPAAVFVDRTGIGQGVVDRLHSLGHQVIGVNFAEAPSGQVGDITCANKRAEMYVRGKSWLETGGAINPDQSFMQQLAAIQYDYDSNNRLLLEPKDRMKERLQCSPDEADAWALTFAHPVQSQQLTWNGQASGGIGVAEMDYDPLQDM